MLCVVSTRIIINKRQIKLIPSHSFKRCSFYFSNSFPMSGRRADRNHHHHTPQLIKSKRKKQKNHQFWSINPHRHSPCPRAPSLPELPPQLPSPSPKGLARVSCGQQRRKNRGMEWKTIERTTKRMMNRFLSGEHNHIIIGNPQKKRTHCSPRTPSSSPVRNPFPSWRHEFCRHCPTRGRPEHDDETKFETSKRTEERKKERIKKERRRED